MSASVKLTLCVPHLFRCGGVEQKDQAVLLRVNPHELQQDAVYPHPLRHDQQPVTAEQTQKHLSLKLQQRARHLGGTRALQPTTFLLLPAIKVSYNPQKSL